MEISGSLTIYVISEIVTPPASVLLSRPYYFFVYFDSVCFAEFKPKTYTRSIFSGKVLKSVKASFLVGIEAPFFSHFSSTVFRFLPDPDAGAREGSGGAIGPHDETARGRGDRGSAGGRAGVAGR